MTATPLATHRVEKPWGRHRLWPGFEQAMADPVGEIWFQSPGDTAPDLLIKYLFTSEKLSVQVHPNDEQARAAGLPRGKDECWVILDAEPHSTIALGTKTPTDRETLHAAALDGSIVDLLDWKPVKAGDFFYSGSGTIHAIGAGITLVEVQQNSETTYRLFDYGRPRELHLDAGIAVSDPVPYQPHPMPGLVEANRNILVEGPSFVLERWADGPRSFALPEGMTGWLVPLKGEGLIDGLAFRAGECIAVEGQAELLAAPGSDLLFAYPGDTRI
jgi:mannose-6-phosphate isomerase